MRALLLCLAMAVSAVAAEIPFTPPVHGPAAANQSKAAVASDGTDFLVVWRDERAVPYEAYATRVARDGTVLDPTGIRIPIDDPYDAQVVWTGSSYLAVWWNAREFAIIGARISRDGALIDGPRVVVQDAQLPSLIRAGNHTVLGFLGGRMSPLRSEALFLDADGAVVSRVTLAAGAGDRGGPQLAWNGSQLIAVWSSGGLIDPAIRIDGVRFDANGVIDTQPRVLIGSGYHVQPRVASDGRDFVVIARSYDTNIHRSLHVSADLTPGSPIDLPISEFEPPAFLWTGSQYVALYQRAHDLNALRLGRDAKPIGSPVHLESAADAGTTAEARVATNGSDLLVAWSASTGTDYDVHGSMVSASSLTRRSKTLLSVTAKRQSDPVIASSGRNVLAVWNEAGGTYARRMTVDRNGGDANPIRLGEPNFAASAVFNGSDYIVAFLESQSGAPRTLTTVRIPESGTLRADNRTNRSVDYSAGSVALAHRGGTTLLTWQNGTAIEAVRLGANGSWIDSVPLLIDSGRARRVTVSAGNDPAFLVAYEVYQEVCCHGQTTSVAIRGARVTSGLTLLDPSGFVIAAAEGTESNATAAWNGREWLVAWQRQIGIQGEVRARRVAANGTVLDATTSDPGLLLATSATMPRLAWDGSRYVLSWLEHAMTNDPLRMFVARFTESGERSGAVVVLGEAEGYGVSGRTSLAVVAPGVVAVGYARIAREPVYGGVARGFVMTSRFVPARRRAI